MPVKWPCNCCFSATSIPASTAQILERFVRDRLRDETLMPFCLGLYDGVVAQRPTSTGG